MPVLSGFVTMSQVSFLLPSLQFLHNVNVINVNDIDAFRVAIEIIADRWSVRELMVAYCLNRINIMDTTTYNILKQEYDVRWQEKLIWEQKLDRPGFIDPKVMKQFNFGNALLSVINRHVRDNFLSHIKAATLLGSKSRAAESLFRLFEMKHNLFVLENA